MRKNHHGVKIVCPLTQIQKTDRNKKIRKDFANPSDLKHIDYMQKKSLTPGQFAQGNGNAMSFKLAKLKRKKTKKTHRIKNK